MDTSQSSLQGTGALEQIDKYGVNGMVSAAIFLRILNDYLDENPRPNPGPFEFMVSSGNAIPAWLVTALTKRFGPVVCNFYGSTEAGLTSIASGPELAERPDTAGRPAIGASVRILDENDNAVYLLAMHQPPQKDAAEIESSHGPGARFIKRSRN